MTQSPEPRLNLELGHGLAALRGNWLWFVVLGSALIVFGMVALSSVVIASLAAAVVIGVLLLMSGSAECLGAFWSRAWSGFFIHLLSGVLAIVVGVLFIRSPVKALATLTLLIAMFLIVAGLFKITIAISYRFAHWGWSLVSGVIDVVLGVLILQELPSSELWVVGMFVGISMIFRGVNWVSLGLALRSHRPAAIG